uniref:Uncharacterized protein n=1 Tax=Anopheles culicifacies TaxID=139723 RepID=A0A182MBD0_9DIPT
MAGKSNPVPAPEGGTVRVLWPTDRLPKGRISLRAEFRALLESTIPGCSNQTPSKDNEWGGACAVIELRRIYCGRCIVKLSYWPYANIRNPCAQLPGASEKTHKHRLAFGAIGWLETLRHTFKDGWVLMCFYYFFYFGLLLVRLLQEVELCFKTGTVNGLSVNDLRPCCNRLHCRLHSCAGVRDDTMNRWYEIDIFVCSFEIIASYMSYSIH